MIFTSGLPKFFLSFLILSEIEYLKKAQNIYTQTGFQAKIGLYYVLLVLCYIMHIKSGVD